MNTKTHTISASTAFQASIFLAAMLIYAAFSSPTPDTVSWAEIAIGFLLVVLILPSLPHAILSITNKNNTIPPLVIAAFLYLLIAPSVQGILITGTGTSDYIRDIIPLLYVFIPVLLLPILQKNPAKWIDILCIALIIVSISFTIRHFYVSRGPISQLGTHYIWGGKDYFPLDPSVLFSTTLLLTLGAKKALSSRTIGTTLKGSTLTIIGLIPLAALIAVVVRAQLSLVLLSIIFIILLQIKTNPKRAIFMLITYFTLMLFIFSDSFFGLFTSTYDLATRKTEAVGISGRDKEIIAVLKNADTIPIIIFGEGWGSYIKNPIGRGEEWRFVHNSFAYFFFKGGLIGLIAWVIYIAWLSMSLVRVFLLSPVIYTPLVLSLANIMVVNVLFEASFKSLTIGVAFSLLPILILYSRSMIPDGIMYNKQDN